MTATANQSETLTVEEASYKIGVSRWLAYQEVARTGQLAGVPVLKIGRRLLIPRRALERVLEGQRPDAPKTA